jgi:hypothetical protein
MRMSRTEFGLIEDTGDKYSPSEHAKLRKATRDRIRTLERHGSRPYVKTNITGKVHLGGWKDQDDALHDSREYYAGNTGEADLEVTWFGQSFMFEIKVGRDTQLRSQEKIERLFTKAGGIYLIVRAPHEATDAMLQWAAQTGRVF